MRNATLRILSHIQITVSIILLLTGCVSATKSSYEQAQVSYSQGDYSRAFNQLLYPVQHNDPRALYAMGFMYYYGIGTEKDQNMGRGLIRRSVAYHYPPAIAALKLINQARFEQYVPFEDYDNMVPIKPPLIRGNRV